MLRPVGGLAGEEVELAADWRIAASSPGEWETPAHARAAGDWRPATVPGTAALALGADPARDFDAEDVWFRVEFARPELPKGEVLLCLDGVATVAQIYLNGELVLESESMFETHSVAVGDRLAETNELAIACRALTPLLRRRRRPAARWRTRVVSNGNLRWYRTMMFGRSPGFAPGPPVVGPWRPVRLRTPARHALDSVMIRPRVQGDVGSTAVEVPAAFGGQLVSLRVGEHTAELTPAPGGGFAGVLEHPVLERWWPHTHGRPIRHRLVIERDGEAMAEAMLGFRELSFASDIRRDGLALEVNRVPVYARGAVWTPADLVGMAPTEAELRRLLETLRDAGMNLLRVVGTGAYESPAFHDLCDELGILVWQDLMFANLDYPLADPDFHATAVREVRTVFGRLAGRPSVAVVCGNSEVEQQAAMLGLEPDLGRDEFYETEVATLAQEAQLDCAVVPSTPTGGALPFHPQVGIAHYFGVSGYFRPPEDARRAGVRFAAESLAFANVPDEVEVPVHHPQWKLGVARDAGTGWGMGAGWDFDDVRDHYLRLRHGIDPVGLRRYDQDRYLALSRAVSGEVMAEVLGEWRRAASPCQGSLVLWAKDMAPGAGLGLLDHRGSPKVALRHVARTFAPVAVWASDEGVGGLAVHVANDRAEPLRATLQVALFTDFEEEVQRVQQPLELPPHTTVAHDLEAILGRFVDPTWAYRFGPPTQDVIALSLLVGGELVSHAFHLPAGPPPAVERPDRLGLRAALLDGSGPWPSIELTSRRFAYGVRIDVPGYRPTDDAFSIEPGGRRSIRLQPEERDPSPVSGGRVTALNLLGNIPIV